MTWIFAADAKIVGGADEAAAKKVQPDVVHEDAIGEGIGGVGEPMGQVKAAWRLRFEGMKNRESGGRYRLVRPEKIAAGHDASLARVFLALGEDADEHSGFFGSRGLEGT